MDKTEMMVAKISSRVLTIGVPTPAVATSTTGLATHDFAACTEPATNSPQISDKTGWISVMDLALAANKIAPSSWADKGLDGVIDVINHGDLICNRFDYHQNPQYADRPPAFQASQGFASSIRSVNFASSETTSNGM